MKDKGFAPLIIIIITTLAIGAGVGGFLVFQEFQEKKMPSFEKTIRREVSPEKTEKETKLPETRIVKDATSPIKPTPSLTQSIQPTKTPQIGSEDKPPVLKNLGIVLDIPNLQTNRAGDMLFDKIVIWEDENLYSDKVFGDFGEMGKRKNGPNYPGVEYNYAVPAGTKVYAAGDGIATSVFYIEHTKDWGVNIQPKQGSRWNIGHEHLVNLAVKTGDAIKAGDILGEATPYWKGYAVTQLAVWTGGQSIVKYCPFEFLDESLKPLYKEKLDQLARDWEEFIGQDVYEQEKWVAPGCLMNKIIER